MREGWRDVALGELFATTNNRLGAHVSEPEVLSVTKHDGVVRASEYFGKRVASARLDTYKVIEPGDWAYSTIHIDEGSIARNRLGVRGVVSPMYTTMRLASDEALPYFCELALRSPRMLRRYKYAQQGSIDRRRSLPRKAFSNLTIPLPPLVEQRRIVDLLEALDATVTATCTVVERAQSALQELRTHLCRGQTSLRVGDILVSLQQLVAVDPIGTYTEIGVRSHGRGTFDKQPVTGEALGTKKVMWMHPGALCFNIVFAWEGAVTVLGPSVAGKIASHRFPNYASKVEAGERFMASFFRTKNGQALLSDCSPGGAGRNRTLNRGRLMDATIRVPPLASWTEIVDALDAAEARLRAAEGALQSLRDLRSNLLSALLSGAHEIPDSYDELLEG